MKYFFKTQRHAYLLKEVEKKLLEKMIRNSSFTNNSVFDKSLFTGSLHLAPIYPHFGHVII